MSAPKQKQAPRTMAYIGALVASMELVLGRDPLAFTQGSSSDVRREVIVRFEQFHTARRVLHAASFCDLFITLPSLGRERKTARHRLRVPKCKTVELRTSCGETQPLRLR
jgi:hypothetical protein